MRIKVLVLFLLVSIVSCAQERPIQRAVWDASWISVPDIGKQDYGVYYFRKDITLLAQPQEFLVYVSGDNRYKLYANEQLVSMGPARSDMTHWNYDTIDLAPYLQTGKNVVAAVVWNEGDDRAEANMSAQTAFLLKGEGDAVVLNTDSTWKCIQDKGYSPKTFELARLTYTVTGPGEIVDMNVHIADWNKRSGLTDGWQKAVVVSPAVPKEAVSNQLAGLNMPWMLQSSMLQQRELKVEHTLGFQRQTIPAHSTKTILLDNQVLTNAYLTMVFNKGKDSHITLAYQESLFTDFPHKGNRNETKGKKMIGREDEIISNGREGQVFTTLTFRTYRYVQLTIHTANEPLTIEDVYGTYTSYPFEMKASIETDNQELQDFLRIGWRTAKLCAWETYTDCPYYEQLQYLGDTRIQMLVTLYNVGDDAFIRNYLNLADESRNVEGVTQSRYPAKTPQYITPYALHYIWSLHDYMMYARQPQFVKAKLLAVRSILEYFHRFQMKDGRLQCLPGWNFTDWVDHENSWDIGVCLPGNDGATCVMDLQLLYAYQMAADLERQLGLKEQASIYNGRAALLAQSIEREYWDEHRGLYADHAEHDTYSQHANALAILTGVAKEERAVSVARQIETDTSLAPASIYFKYYTHQAMTKAGLGDHYLSWLDKWRENVRMGLSTWAETSDVDATRSDCHAWGSSPNIEFFRTILGIDSDAPGFSRVRIEPHLGDISRIGGEMPHPNGTIQVKYQRTKEGFSAVINLPNDVSGILVWQGSSYPLHSGSNAITVR